MTIILGIDPGLQHTGWGVVRAQGSHISYLGCGTIHSNSKQPMAERLACLSRGIKEVVGRFVPDQAAIEETFLNKNPASSLKLGHARGAMILTLCQEGIVPYEYAATLVKKSVVGVGRADKDQVQMMVSHLLPGAAIDSADAADALAVAICHIGHMKTMDNRVLV